MPEALVKPAEALKERPPKDRRMRHEPEEEYSKESPKRAGRCRLERIKEAPVGVDYVSASVDNIRSQRLTARNQSGIRVFIHEVVGVKVRHPGSLEPANASIDGSIHVSHRHVHGFDSGCGA